LAGVFDWKLSDTSDFRQMLNSYIGEDSTISKSVSSLKVQIVGNLATKFSFTIKHTSDPPENTDDVDTETAVTLVFGF
jgi:putative salt-induced outer membrane protein YdiY